MDSSENLDGIGDVEHLQPLLKTEIVYSSPTVPNTNSSSTTKKRAPKRNVDESSLTKEAKEKLYVKRQKSKARAKKSRDKKKEFDEIKDQAFKTLCESMEKAQNEIVDLKKEAVFWKNEAIRLQYQNEMQGEEAPRYNATTCTPEIDEEDSASVGSEALLFGFRVVC